VIPAFIIPVINRFDLLTRCIESIDHPVRELLVIDNSDRSEAENYVMDAVEANPQLDTTAQVWVISPRRNLGVAASWNLGIRQFPSEKWWCIANADTRFAEGDLARLCAEMTHPGARWVGMAGDWRVFGLAGSVVRKVGWFDENFHPIYCEDADYERRCTLAGVPWYSLPGESSHIGSVSWKSDDQGGRNNARTYPENVAYYVRKWGAPPRSGEHFSTPFDAGGSLADWRLDIDRLRDLEWR